MYSHDVWKRAALVRNLLTLTWTFSCAAAFVCVCLENQWHIAFHFCISRLCPLLYITAYELRINHFPASLLHEMKVFIMVTVGRCEAFAVIYLGKMIDSLTVSERRFAAGLFSVSAFCWAGAGRTSPVRRPSLNVPCSSVWRLRSGPAQLSSLPGRCRQWSGGGKRQNY